MPYVIYADPPKKGWEFKKDYFPRKMHYLKDAINLKNYAIICGGRNVRIEKV